MYDLVIIGGGFAGIYSAWRSARAGLRVAIIDQAGHLGGSMRSVETLGYLVDIGTHNLDLRTDRSAEFYADILGDNLKVLQDYSWASTTGRAWTSGFEMPDFSTSDAELCQLALAELAAPKSDPELGDGYLDLLNRRFGASLTARLVPMVEKVIGGTADELDKSAADSLGMFSRVKLGTDEAMVKLKSSSQRMDDILAVTLSSGASQFLGKSATLKWGYPAHAALRAFCEAAESRLRALGVDLFLNSTVENLECRRDSINLQANETPFDTRFLLWTLHDNSLLRILGVNLDISAASLPVGAAVHVFEVQQDDILGPAYLHDFTENRACFRYASAGCYSGQVRPDGRTFVLAEIPCHPARIKYAEDLSMVAWDDLKASGFLHHEATATQHTVLSYPVAYSLPKKGWEPIIQAGEQAVKDLSGQILQIPFGHRGRDRFMTFFENTISQLLTEGGSNKRFPA